MNLKAANFIKQLFAIPFFLVIVFAFYLQSCLNEHERIDLNNTVKLSFSSDTLSFDTIFTDLESTSKWLTIYNNSKNAIKVDEIKVAGIENSPFSLIINGKEQQSIQNLEVLGKDSIVVFAKVLINSKNQNLPFEIRDSILFDYNNFQQDVKLIAWGQDSEVINGSETVLDCSTTWDSSKPYRVYDSLIVEEGCTLRLLEGTNVFMGINSSIIVEGNLIIEGSSSKKAVLTSLRNDEGYNKLAGQWLGIFFKPSSNNNSIQWAEIKNAFVGIRVEINDDDISPDLEIQHTIIENMAVDGLQAFGSDLSLKNTLINNCLDHTIALVGGGNYTIEFCTIANFQFDFKRETPSIVLSNAFGDLTEDLNLDIKNTILWGSLEEEFEIVNEPGTSINLLFQNNILKTNIESFNLNQNIINEDPRFKGIPSDQMFLLDSLSPAIGNAVKLDFRIDLSGRERDENPDIGAYEYFEEDDDENEDG